MEQDRVEFVACVKGTEEEAWRWLADPGPADRDLAALLRDGYEAHVIKRRVTISDWRPAYPEDQA